MIVKHGDYVQLKKEVTFDKAQCNLTSNNYITGRLVNNPEVGCVLHIANDCKDKNTTIGILTTSKIQKIQETLLGIRFQTVNSTYNLFVVKQ